MKTLIQATALFLIGCAMTFAQGVDVPVAVAVASDGYVYVTGTSMNASGQMEYLTVAYDPAGRLQGSVRSLGNAAGPSIPSGIAVANDNIIVTGTSPTASTGFDIVTVSYNRSTLVSAEYIRQPAGFTLSQSYPNPVASDGSASIQFTLPAQGHIRLNVVDAVGKEVAVLVDEVLHSGSHHVSFSPASLPSGTYFYMLRSSSQSEVRKLAVVR